MKCLNCSTDTTNAKYCNNQCQQDHKRNETKKEFDCVAILPGGHGRPGRRVKEYLINTKGHRCENCTLEVWLNKPIPLVLDHINGNPDDWQKHNLRLICANCDHQSETFAGKNKKNKIGGRKIRMSRYRNMKSY